jgi:hypothetical protein
MLVKTDAQIGNICFDNCFLFATCLSSAPFINSRSIAIRKQFPTLETEMEKKWLQLFAAPVEIQ